MQALIIATVLFELVRARISRRGLQAQHSLVHSRCMVGITNGCGHLFDQRSSVIFRSIKSSMGASKQDQAIKNFDRRCRWKYRVHSGDYPLQKSVFVQGT